METLWSLGHKKLKTVEKNIYSNQLAQRVAEGIKNGGSENDWVVWRPGWQQWKHIIEIEELIMEVQLLLKINEQTDEKPEAPPLEFNIPTVPQNNPQPYEHKYSLPKAPVKEVNTTTENSVPAHSVNSVPARPQNPNQGTKEETHSTSSPQPKGGWVEQRKHKRVEVRLRCIIRSETLTFRTFTQNISLGGVALENAIPTDFEGTECNIYITATHIKRNLKFKIKMSQRPGSRFFSFENAEPSFQTELNSWLEDYINANKGSSKAS